MLLLARFKVIGHSMEPTIKNGGTVLVSNLLYLFQNPRVGDIVAVREAGEIFIKRITDVQKDKLFLEGDNKQDSLDSRKFGFVSRGKIIGKVFYKS
jgi:nickel-type superoxide dismutase maturation protease